MGSLAIEVAAIFEPPHVEIEDPGIKVFKVEGSGCFTLDPFILERALEDGGCGSEELLADEPFCGSRRRGLFAERPHERIQQWFVTFPSSHFDVFLFWETDLVSHNQKRKWMFSYGMLGQ